METPSRYKNAELGRTPITRQEVEAIYSTRKGLYIHGPVGTGKTYIAYAIKHYLENGEAHIGSAGGSGASGGNAGGGGGGTVPAKPRRLQFYNATELLADIRHDFDATDPYAKKHVADRILESRNLLIIDDLGAEKPSEWVAETLYRIINHRYENELPVVITSNLSLDQLAQRLGDRTASRLAELCNVVELTGRDRRLQNS